MIFVHTCTGTCSREWCLHLCSLANTTEQALCFVVLSEWTDDVTSDSKSTAHNVSSNTQPVGAHVTATRDELGGHRMLVHDNEKANERESSSQSTARKYFVVCFLHVTVYLVWLVYILGMQFCPNVSFYVRLSCVFSIEFITSIQTTEIVTWCLRIVMT